MSRTDDNGLGQRDQATNTTTLNNTNWETSRPHLKSTKDSDNVSPRSHGQIPLAEMQTEDIRRKIEEAKARASPPVHDLPRKPSQERVRPAEPSATTAPTGLHAVPPELLSELRKIIREEFVQLNKTDTKDEDTDKSRQASVQKEGPSSPTRPFVQTTDASGAATASSKEATIDRRASVASATPSPTTPVPQKISPRQSTVRFSEETKPAAPDTPRITEVRKMSSLAKGIELTAIDKRWGVLFDKDGTPTKRMQHIVKGLAKYIVDDFMPQDSIVITPEKMAVFYSHHRLEREVFPFASLFKSRPKDLNEALSSLYDDLGCQYFLVKGDDRSRPSVPSLTPAGFVHWLITMIQAYPDEEAKRLDRVFSDLPIEADSVLDGKPERLPKQISRYLFPEKPLKSQQRLVDEAVKDFEDDLKASESKLSRRSSTSSKKSSSIVATTSSDKRLPTTASGSQSSRYVPDSSSKDPREDGVGVASHDKVKRHTSTAGNSGRDGYEDDRNRRSSMPPPPPPGSKSGRTTFGSGSIDSSGRSGHGSSSSSNSREAHASSSSSKTHGVSSSSFVRRNRSPQRKSYSQSVPASIDCDDNTNDRYRSSGGISPAAVNVANAVLGSSNMTSSALVSGTGTALSTAAGDSVNSRDAWRNSSVDFGTHRESKRTSVDDSAARMSNSVHSLRDRADQDEGSSSRSSKRRSMVLPDVRGRTWDDYLRSSAPKNASSAFKNATSAFIRRNDTG